VADCIDTGAAALRGIQVGPVTTGREPEVPRRPRRIGPWYRLAVMVIKPSLWLFVRRRWSGQEHIPATGGVIVATNHVSHVDPFTFAHFVYDAGRVPRFLVKSELFGVFFIGRVLRGARQVPVRRNTATAAQALDLAVAALREGECVAIYPEGTLTRDPDLWPMSGRTGVARLALDAGVPVIPVAHWGEADILYPYSGRLRLLPRKRVQVVAGPPVDLSPYVGRQQSADVLRQATDDIMTAVADMMAELRGQARPAGFWDRRRGTRRPAAADQRRTA
jgi:1-acyl-sn-glycerol-3-phosphate acyltransferase